MQAIILAGGRGTRLRPYTTILPKPLMPLGDMPVIEVLIRQLVRAGFDDIVLSVGYLGELLKAYLGDGTRMGGSVRFVREEEPLGTAGPIGLVSETESDFLLINGDTLTDLDYRGFLEQHRRSGAMATIGTSIRRSEVDYGVLECDERGRLVRYNEKPVHQYRVSMGVNAFRSEVRAYLRPRVRHDLPDLMRELVADGQHVACHEPNCFWLDIGRPADYEKALEVFVERRAEFLGG